VLTEHVNGAEKEQSGAVSGHSRKRLSGSGAWSGSGAGAGVTKMGLSVERQIDRSHALWTTRITRLARLLQNMEIGKKVTLVTCFCLFRNF